MAAAAESAPLLGAPEAGHKAKAWLSRDHAEAAIGFLWQAGGIMACLNVYGLLQEKIMTQDWGGEAFTFTTFMVLCNRIFAMVSGVV